MKLKLFTFRFSDSADGFDDQPLQEFMADKEIIDFSEHFFVHEKTPYLKEILRRIDLSLEKLRLLLRMCHDMQYLDHKGYEYAARNINEAGKMVGGWRKQQENRGP